MSFVNIPNLCLRVVLWQKYGADVSVLIMKNVLCLTLGMYEIAEYFGEGAPRRCVQCNQLFENSVYDDHEKKCSQETSSYKLTSSHG